MNRAPTLRGQVFGSLTVIRRAGTSSDGSAIWLCRCSCGQRRKAVGFSLRNGKIHNCKRCRRIREGSWSEAEHQQLRELYPTGSLPELASRLRRSEGSIRSRVRMLGLRKAVDHGGRFPWTRRQETILRKLYPDHWTRELRKHLPSHSMASIHTRARQLGIRKSATFRKMQREVDSERLTRDGVAHRFPKGIVPVNKGLRRPGYAPGRMRETQFKKGQPPMNAMPLWSFRWYRGGNDKARGCQGYLALKTGKPGPKPMNGWEFVHKLIWEQANGPLPHWTEARLWWKDGDHANNSLANLELVNAEEHMARTTIQNLPPKLKQVIQLTGALKRKIRNRQKPGDEGKKSNAEEHDGRSAQSPVRCA